MSKKRLMPEDSELGKSTTYDRRYNPDKLFLIPRQSKRIEIGIDPHALPFYGFDLWNHYEVSWLNPKGKPVVALAQIVINCTSVNIIESKSMKLYFNSFNNTCFDDFATLENIICKDIQARVESDVFVKLLPLTDDQAKCTLTSLAGNSIDHLDIICDQYEPDATLLTTESEIVSETLYSDLLKSNCLVTNQPDWGSVQISYTGKKINPASLLKYIVSFRNHNEFHEQCVERIFIDIMRQCAPSALTVYARYTRRGGLDINPYRTTSICDFADKNMRLIRQ